MSEEPEVELDEAEQAALAALRQGPAPPAELEGRVVGALRAQGLLEGGSQAGARVAGAARWRRWTIAAGLAASLAAFGAGWWARSAVPGAAPGASASADRYVLLLHDTGRVLAAAEEERLVAEYAGWAADLRTRGVVIGGEKLEDARWLLGPGGSREEAGPASGAVAGYFLIEAADPAAALAVAESCPHLRHGGRVELRRIAVLRRG